MPLYMFQGAYTPESLAAQIKEPQDRVEATRSLVRPTRKLAPARMPRSVPVVM
jgi:hypothetical protein